MHWGKLHFLTREQLLARYPAAETFIRIRRELDPAGIFSTTTCGRCRLDPAGRRAMADGGICGRSRVATVTGCIPRPPRVVDRDGQQHAEEFSEPSHKTSETRRSVAMD